MLVQKDLEMSNTRLIPGLVEVLYFSNVVEFMIPQ